MEWNASALQFLVDCRDKVLVEQENVGHQKETPILFRLEHVSFYLAILHVLVDNLERQRYVHATQEVQELILMM